VWRYGVAEPGIWQLLRNTPPRQTTYVVQPGDTLSGIAAHWNTTAAAVAYENGIADPNNLIVGTRLRVPGWGPGPTPVSRSIEAAPKQASHVVQPGDSLLGIARRYGTSVDALQRANGIVNVNLVRIGQRIWIP
jgi:LysM repeat protein